MKARSGKSEKGFTLLELMIAVSITLILTSLIVYNILGELPKYRLRSSANKVAATLQYLKIRAVTTSRIAWLDVNYATADDHYYTGFVDVDGSGTSSAAEYTETKLDFPDTVSSTPCFKLPATVSFGFPDGYTSGSGPDGTTFPGSGNYINTPGGYSNGGYFGYRPTGVPVVNPAANMTATTPCVIYLRNELGQGYAVSIQITGRVRVWQWTGGAWR
jgi:prepilin-type N-terminal cleavage/methylation domain-containing protein